MNPVTDFFLTNLPLTLFIYGLAFFIMGITIFINSRQETALKITKELKLLALFGIFQAIALWGHFFIFTLRLFWGEKGIKILEFLTLASKVFSYTFLFLGGISFYRKKILGEIAVFLVFLFLIFLFEKNSPVAMANYEVFFRYVFCLPGAILFFKGFLKTGKTLSRFRNSGIPKKLKIAGIGILLFGISEVFSVPSYTQIPHIISEENFSGLFLFPPQILRAILSIFIAIYVIRFLDIFRLEMRFRIEELISNLQKFATETEALFEIAFAVVEGKNFSTLVELAAEKTQKLIGAERITLFLNEKGKLRSVIAQGLNKEIVLEKNQGIAGFVFETRKPYFTNDVSRDPKHFSIATSYGYKVKNILAFPLSYKGKKIGVIEAINKKSGFSEEDIPVFEKIANTVAAVIYRETVRNQPSNSK